MISGTARSIDAAKQKFAATLEVQQCYYATGEVGFVLVVVVPSRKAYETLTRCLTCAFAG